MQLMLHRETLLKQITRWTIKKH